MPADIKNTSNSFHRDILQLDAEQEVQKLEQFLRDTVFHHFRKRGAVLGISGGIDSSVVAALCAQALGPEKVLGILLPEKESSDDSARLALELAAGLGIKTITEDITGALEGAGCYQRRDDAIRRLFPDYGPGWKSKITLPGSLLDQNTLNFFYLAVISPTGEEFRQRIPNSEFFQIMAASNFKQRTRMSMLYYHAELHNYAVIGTPNKNEHELGFFVKYGDGGTDVSPIVHLFKSQVYQLARCLNIPQEIQDRTPTSDTYNAGSSQEEFFFRLPFDILDTIWAGHEQNLESSEIAAVLGITAEQVERVVTDITRKQRTTQYLRTASISWNNRSSFIKTESE